MARELQKVRMLLPRYLNDNVLLPELFVIGLRDSWLCYIVIYSKVLEVVRVRT